MKWEQSLTDYMAYQDQHYRNPAKLDNPVEIEDMECLKRSGQAARQAFSKLAAAFGQAFPDWTQGRVSAWMNQAQVARPHFWVYYFPPENRSASPSFALRLVSDQGVLTVCLELSFIERSRQEETLAQQARILEVPAQQEAYYWVQDSDKQTRRMTTSESHRQELVEAYEAGQVRKVLLRQDMRPLADYGDLEAVVQDLVKAVAGFWPLYQVTQS